MHGTKSKHAGHRELWMALAPHTGSLISICLFSVAVNLLVLTGPLFMLQVYDRVLTSRSEETLVALVVLVCGLYAIMGVLDYARGRVAARVGTAFQSRLDPDVLAATVGNAVAGGLWPPGDLAAVRRLFLSSALFSILDLPWTLIFIVVIFAFHPALGWVALAGGGALVCIAGLSQLLSSKLSGAASRIGNSGNALAGTIRQRHEPVRGLGMEVAIQQRWLQLRNLTLAAQLKLSDIDGYFTSLIKTLRLFLQSLILAVGAYLVLHDQITAGGMIASSIMLGRALAPIEQLIAQRAIIVAAKSGWRALSEFFGNSVERGVRSPLPRPRSIIEVSGLVAAPPGKRLPTLKINGFDLAPGQALGVIGNSGSGKSSLAKVLSGIWKPIAGTVRFDGTSIEHFGNDRGLHIGYLPQSSTIFEATVAENIARLSPYPDSEEVIIAAKKVGAHEMIVRLPDGYDTYLSGEDGALSGGQRQRIALARAFYGDPVLLVLDEPSACLDAAGVAALNIAVNGFKAEGGVAIILSNRPSGITECDRIVIMRDGMISADGPPDEVLKTKVRNYSEIASNVTAAVQP